MTTLDLERACALIDAAAAHGRLAEAEMLCRQARLTAPSAMALVGRHALALARQGRGDAAEAILFERVDLGGSDALTAVALAARLRADRDDLDGAVGLLEPLTQTPELREWALERLLSLTFGRIIGARAHAWIEALLALEPGFDDAPIAGPVGEDDVRFPPDAAADIAASLRRHGCALLRGAFDPTALAPAAQRLAAQTDADAGPGYRDFLSVVGGADAAHAMIPPALTQALTLYFQRPARLALDHCWARRVDPTAGAYLHWHQDAARIFINGVVCWTPLDPCGADAPGLEIAARRIRRLLDLDPVTSAAEREVMDLDALAQWAPNDTRVRPLFVPGDCALFLTSQAHRSWISPTMTGSRRSLEFRFTPARLSDFDGG